MNVLYEDSAVVITHAAQASKGHIQIFPKLDVLSMDDLSEDIAEHMLFCANFCSAVLFELLGAHGTNIILTEGEGLHIDVVERLQDDGIDLMWKPKQIGKDEFGMVASQIKDRIMLKAGKPIQDALPKQEILPAKEPAIIEEENYLLKQLDKIP